MKRKIFKMIGIVLGSVFGFTGAVFGVMAAMGKFKTPVVYPTVLKFAITEQIVLEGKTYDPKVDWTTQFEDKNNAPKIEWFILEGTNPKSEHEVNKTKCFIWFEDSDSSKLITLCDKNGKPLNPNSSLRYEVNCNEPIYYMINNVSKNETTDGKVVLYARSENETLKRPETPMTIWIDRKVESVFVDYSQSDPDERNLTQSIHLGIDMGFDFKYLVNTPLSLKPISKESAKEIELYYVTTNKDADYGTDYYRVTPNACEDNNTSSPVANILDYNNGTFRFQSSTSGSHKFILAVFPTYQAKTEYLASVEGLEIENPNYNKTLSMLTTELNVTVEDIEISKAGLSGDNIVLDLYQQDNYIYLNNENEDNNLGLYMKKGVAPNQVDDFTRFDEVNIRSFTEDDVWSDLNATFSNGDIVWDATKTLNPENIIIVTSKEYISNNLIIIDYIYDQEDPSINYYCNNGVAVLDTKGTLETEDDDIKLLKAGSYLNFYVYNSTSGTYTITDFDYEANAIGTGKDKKWQIIAKELPELNGQSLRIGILVVNNSGEFKIDNYFDAIPVAINELELSYDYKDFNGENVSFTASNATADFSITFDDANIYYPTLSYDNILQNLVGTYTNFVYVVEQNANNIVDTIPSIKYVVGEGPNAKTYVVVGYMDPTTNEFVNEIRVNDHLSATNKTCEIHMLQLKHLFNGNIDDVINDIINSEEYLTNGEVTLTATQVVKLEEETITVNAAYVLNTALLSFVHSTSNIDDPNDYENASVYENTSGQTVTITSTNAEMLNKIVEFYGVDKTFVKVTSQYSGRITIGDVDTAAGTMTIHYQPGNALEKPNKLSLDMWLEINSVEFGLGTVTILNGSPDQIVLRSVGGDITLASNLADVKDEDCITAILGYENGSFAYSFKVNEREVQAENIFNKSILFESRTGFQDKDNLTINKGQTLPVNYSVSNADKSIFNTDLITFNPEGNLILGVGLIGKSGDVVLQVTIGSTTGYIKVKTDTSAFTVSTITPNQTEYDHDTGTANLSNFIEFKYNGTGLLESKSNMVYISIAEENITYGDGKLFVFPDGDNLTLKKSAEADPVLTIADNGAGWTFTRSNYYVSLSLYVDVETVAGNITIKINFTSSVTVDVSPYWTNRTLYAGTQVSLQGTDYSVFRVYKASGVTATVAFRVKGENSNLSNIFRPSDSYIGELVIIPVIDDNPIDIEYVFNVKPNVIAKVKQSNLTSETTYTLNGADDGIYKLQTYQTDITFGGEEGKLYTKTVYYEDAEYKNEAPAGEVTDYYKIVENEDYLIDLTIEDDIYSNLEFMATVGSEPTIDDGATLSIGAMTNLNVEKSREIKLVYNNVEIRKDLFNISNKYTIEIKSILKVDNVITLMDLTTYSLSDIIAITNSDNGFVLSGVEIEAEEEIVVTNTENNLTLNTKLTKVCDSNVVITFYFRHETSGQELRYCTTEGSETYKIVPYQPVTKVILISAYSGSNYDLFGGIYEASAIEENKKIQKLYVTGVKYSPSLMSDNVASTLISNWVEGGSGYTSGISNPAYVVAFNEISGDNLTVYVEFSITYVGGNIYTYYVPLTISNRQAFVNDEVTYPEADMELNNGYFKFLSGYEADALEISGLSEVPVDNLYNLTNLSYEAVLIYTNTSTTINFSYDDIKKLSRAVVTNYDGSTNETDLTIELIGYQNNGGMADYADKVKNAPHETNTITLPSAQQGMFGTLIFKLSTVSGNYKYYNIYVYCKAAQTASNVNYGNNLEVIYYQNGLSYLNGSTNVVNVVKTNSEATTYVGLVASIDSTTFYNSFKTEYNANTTKVYLYNGVYTGEEETGAIPFNYNDKQWQPLTTETINVNKHFNVVTLGLVMDDGVQEYCYGTITIYVQPQNSVAVNGLAYQLPNGYFTANINANKDEIEIPFSDWADATVEIKADGLLAQGYKLESGCIVDKDLVLEQEATLDDEDKIIAINGTSVELKQKVENDLVFTVKYTYNNTIVYATYTYGETTIPAQTSSIIRVGEFVDEATGFDTDVDIKSITEKQGNVANKTYFFGTYDGEYTVSVGEEVTAENTFSDVVENIYLDQFETISISFVDGKLTFPQSHEEQTFKITITYTNFGSSNKTRIFTFKVLPGYEFASIGSSEGLSTSNRANTVATNDYTDEVGSSLDFAKTELIANRLYKFTVADFVIYTNANSKLILTFDENSYVLGLIDNKLELASTGNAEFVHTAVDKNIIMTISVQDVSGQEFAKRNLYLNVVKTYTTLMAVYKAEGADHENVESGSLVEDLHASLMSSANKVVLIDNDGNEVTSAVSLSNMGFATYGNPNFIRFTSNSFATIKTMNDGDKFKQNDIQFNTVTTNTLCEIFLNNDAGIETNSVKYVYQIMAGLEEGEVDGLDYSSTTGYDGTNETNPYISFVLEDTKSDKAYSKKFVLGTMQDLRNEGVFLVDGDGFAKQTNLIGGYENAIQYLRVSGNYNLYLTLNLDTKNVELLVERNAGSIVQSYENNIEINISLGGMNGAETIVKDLTLVLSNHNIEEKFKETVDNSIYAGYKIDLFKDGKFVENGSSTPTLTYELAESTYTRAGQEYEIITSPNDLFVYDQGARTIQTNAVASDVSAVINFLVIDGDYVIKTVTYKLNIYLNMKFVVNGDETSALETDFVLTNKDAIEASGTKFPITKEFVDGSYIKTEDIKTTTKTTYYKVLSYDLYRLKSQTNELLMSKDSVKVTLNSDISGDVLKVTNLGIVFYQDYSGEIELKLSVETKNGTYSQYWTIYVTPIVEIDLAKTESTILQTSASAAFNSGAAVELISDLNDQSNEDVGVIVDTNTNFSDYINNGGVAVNYTYKIYTFAESSGISGLTSSQLFNLKNDDAYYEYFVASDSDNGTLNGHKFAITLPNVPSTLDVQSYLVVYEVYVEYLDLTRADSEVEVFYVTYNVINKQKVKQYQYQLDPNTQDWYSSDNVDVTKRVYETAGNYYLDLFYYQEELAGTNYKLYYSENNITLYDGTQTHTVTSQVGNELTFGLGTFKYNTQSRQLSKQNATDTTKFDVLGVMDINPHYKELVEDKAYYSVFESKFTNIVEFKNFIDLYLFDETNNNVESITIGENAFKLVEIADGRYGIDLNENGGNLFNNESTKKLSLVINGVETISLENFRLYVNSSISSKGKLYTISEMGLSNYFTAGEDCDSSLKIIGIGTPTDNSWVNNATETPTTEITKDYGTISIPNGTGNNQYKLYKVTYTGVGGGTYYSVTQDYYYIEGTSLAVPSYTGVESYLYSVAYNPNERGNVVLNLANAVKVWTMNANGELVNSSNSVTYSEFIVISPTYGITNPNPDYANKTLTLSAEVLSEYKLNNSTAKSYPTITATIKVNGTTTLQLVIEYALPNE